MIKTVVYCDFCEKPIPEYHGNRVDICITREFKTRETYPHMCRRCAERIDEIIRDYKADAAHKAGLASMYAQINKERREMLGSEG